MTGSLIPQSVAVDGWTAWDYPEPPPDSQGNLWIWQTITGWFGNLPVRASSVARPMMDGDYDGPAPFGGRTIEISGALLAPNRTVLQYGLDKMAGVLARDIRRATLTVNEGMRGQVRTSTVRLAGPTLVNRTGPTSAQWSISLYASDPLRYSQSDHSVSLMPSAEGTGRVYDLTHDRKYGPIGSSGRATIINSGNASVAPVITFLGPSTNPRFQIIGGDRIALRYDIQANQRIICDCYNRTVTLDGVSKRQYLTPDSRWLQFWDGGTEVYYDNDAGAGLCIVNWRDAWI